MVTLYDARFPLYDTFIGRTTCDAIAVTGKARRLYPFHYFVVVTRRCWPASTGYLLRRARAQDGSTGPLTKLQELEWHFHAAIFSLWMG